MSVTPLQKDWKPFKVGDRVWYILSKQPPRRPETVYAAATIVNITPKRLVIVLDEPTLHTHRRKRAVVGWSCCPWEAHTP